MTTLTHNKLFTDRDSIYTQNSRQGHYLYSEQQTGTELMLRTADRYTQNSRQEQYLYSKHQTGTVVILRTADIDSFYSILITADRYTQNNRQEQN